MTFINRKIYLIKSNNKDKIDNLWIKAKHPENVKNNILLAIFPDNIKPKSLTNLEKITYHIQDKKYYNIERYGNIDKVYTSGIYQFNFTGFINSELVEENGIIYNCGFSFEFIMPDFEMYEMTQPKDILYICLSGMYQKLNEISL